MVPITGDNMTDKPTGDMVTIAARIPINDLQVLRQVQTDNQIKNISEVIRIAIGAYCMLHRDGGR